MRKRGARSRKSYMYLPTMVSSYVLAPELHLYVIYFHAIDLKNNFLSYYKSVARKENVRNLLEEKN